jgi:hypothetical protein
MSTDTSSGEPDHWTAILYRTVYRVSRVIMRNGGGVRALHGAAYYLALDAADSTERTTKAVALVVARQALRDVIAGRPEQKPLRGEVPFELGDEPRRGSV